MNHAMNVNAVPPHAAPAADAKTREAFDSSIGEMFFTQLLGAMRQTQGKPAYFHGGQAEEMFKSQLDQTIAQQMTKTHARDFTDALYDRFALGQMQRQ
jgi:Rod binding domain-containing protein